MTLSEFKQLDWPVRAVEMFTAQTIAKRYYKDHIIYLKQHGSFYFEVFHNRYTGWYQRYIAFDDIALLEPYINAINIDDLFW